MQSLLPAGTRANQTPIRSFATTPIRKRVTLVLEMPHEPQNLWEVVDTIWCGLFKSVRWGVNQIIVGPIVLYERIITKSLLLVTSESLHYSTDKAIWSHIVGGVPVSATKVLWKLEPQATSDHILFAIEDWNETASDKQHVIEIKPYDRESDSMISIGRRSHQRVDMGPRQDTMAVFWQVLRHVHQDFQLLILGLHPILGSLFSPGNDATDGSRVVLDQATSTP
jgi:hypothetical protein